MSKRHLYDVLSICISISVPMHHHDYCYAAVRTKAKTRVMWYRGYACSTINGIVVCSLMKPIRLLFSLTNNHIDHMD